MLLFGLALLIPCPYGSDRTSRRFMNLPFTDTPTLSHRRTWPIMWAISLGLLAASCSGQNATAYSGSAFVDEQGHTTTPELQALDQRLDTVEGNTDTLQERVDDLEEQVIAKMGEPQMDIAQDMNLGPVVVTVDHNSVVRVDDVIMTNDDFLDYLTTHKSTFCQPIPQLIVHTDAQFARVAWVLERMYALGCSSVATETRYDAPPR